MYNGAQDTNLSSYTTRTTMPRRFQLLKKLQWLQDKRDVIASTAQIAAERLLRYDFAATSSAFLGDEQKYCFNACTAPSFTWGHQTKQPPNKNTDNNRIRIPPHALCRADALNITESLRGHRRPCECKSKPGEVAHKRTSAWGAKTTTNKTNTTRRPHMEE